MSISTYLARLSIHVVKVKVAQSYLTLCDPMDYTVHGILQARILEWVAFPFSRGSSQPGDRTQVSSIAGRFFASWPTREAQSIHVGSEVTHTQAPLQWGASAWGPEGEAEQHVRPQL